MGSTDLVVRVLADTSGATGEISKLEGALGKALGIGAAGAIVAFGTQAASDMQSAMAKIQAAYNSADFAPGTAKYSAAKDQLLKDSTELATSFGDLADVYSQGARFVDDFGNRLPIDKVNEYVDTMARLAKVSTDALAPTDIGQRVDVFEKLFGQTNFANVGSAISAESGIHNQGEAPMLDTSIAIAQYGADLGVTQAQAIGIGNYLTDLKAGGQQGGASTGRMLLRMDTSADEVLDPQARYADEQKKRTGQERLDDLQTSIKEAEARRSEMYGQNGLKTQYKRHPSEVMAADDRISKLQRDIADQQTNIAHEDDPNRSARGKMNVSEMAKTAGLDPTAYATLFKSNPMGALQAFASGLHNLPETARGAAETAAGITNVRDIKTINTLADRPDVADSYVALAQGELDNPKDLLSRSDIPLGTTAAKASDAVNAATNTAAIVADPARAALDATLTSILDDVRTKGFTPLENDLQSVTDHLDLLNVGLGALAPVMAFFGAAAPGILAKLMAGAAAAAPASEAAGTAAGIAGGAGGTAAALAGGVGAVIAAGLAVPILADLKAEVDAYQNARAAAGLQPITLNFGDIVHQGQTPEQMFDAIKAQFVAAFHAAMNGQPVTGQLGGAYSSGSAP